ncbi:PD-(D/E)XK nuclease domain-containing protein [Flavobacterium aquicola]|uniref:Uncharacterized protein n=1 Tax=Flavobacterium aquicola TaxID=1682742 RepID=A0A3E0DZN6_9FLAO|nr:hypothetical protein [Flavobacterium aquicola]REG90830.1 hypothetical protein C8P67_11842 [Flavobacterium aquicola]
MTDRKEEIQVLSKEISTQLHKLEVTFWEVYVYPGNDEEYYEDTNGQLHFNYEREDKTTWLFYGTRALFYKICLFLELKNVPLYYKMFIDKFQLIINDQKIVCKSRGPLYTDDEPSMIIHDEFREFLRSFQEFNIDYFEKLEVNKLKQILENTNPILAKTKSKVTNETSIYTPIKWFVEIVYPTMRSLGKARFIKKFTTYHPDILIPEISSAVEYKYIRKGVGISNYLDQIKTDADSYVGDPEYKFFYAVVYFEDKSEINPEGFRQAVVEKKFPENWTLIAL